MFIEIIVYTLFACILTDEKKDKTRIAEHYDNNGKLCKRKYEFDDYCCKETPESTDYYTKDGFKYLTVKNGYTLIDRDSNFKIEFKDMFEFHNYFITEILLKCEKKPFLINENSGKIPNFNDVSPKLAHKIASIHTNPYKEEYHYGSPLRDNFTILKNTTDLEYIVVLTEKLKEDLIKVVLSEPVDIFYSTGGCLEKINKKIDYFKEEDEEEEKKEEEEEKNKLEFDNNIFSFVFLGKDPFDDKYEGVFAKKNREGLTVQLEDKDPSLSKILYFDYFKKKIQSLFELDRIKNFLEKQKDFLGAKAASAGEEIKELLDNAFYLLKRYSEGNLEPQVKVLSKVKVIKEKNCCEKCCENICV